MSTTTTLFVVGDVVVWSPAGLADSLRLDRVYGNGPFLIIQVEAVPTHCQYPHSHCSALTHSQHCNVITSRFVGHSQLVAIRLPGGGVLQDEAISGRNRLFSGWWFAHESQTVSGLEPEMNTVVPTYPGEEFPPDTGEYIMPGYPTNRA